MDFKEVFPLVFISTVLILSTLYSVSPYKASTEVEKLNKWQRDALMRPSVGNKIKVFAFYILSAPMNPFAWIFSAITSLIIATVI